MTIEIPQAATEAAVAEALDVKLELKVADGLYMTSGLASIEDEGSPVDVINVGFPVPMTYHFHSRKGHRYVVDLRPIIDAAIRKVGEIEARAQGGEE